MKKIILLFFFLSIAFSVFTQENSISDYIKINEHVSKIKITDFYFQTGTNFQPYTSGRIQQFGKLVPNSQILNLLPTFPMTLSVGYNNNIPISLIAGFKLRNKKKTGYKERTELRIGFDYYSSYILGSAYGNYKKTTYDTIANLYGQPTPVDSTESTRCVISYSSIRLRFNGSMIYRTELEGRWSFFSGYGIAAGININHTDLYYQNRIGDGLGNYSDTALQEHFRNKNNFGFSVFAPAGFDFRMGNERVFWKSIHLFYEFRLGADYSFIPELKKTIISPYFQNRFGVRVSFTR